MNIVFGSANVDSSDGLVVDQYDFTKPDNTCTVAKMRAAWGEPKERVYGMVELVPGG
jgi:hypothetical protein